MNINPIKAATNNPVILLVEIIIILALALTITLLVRRWIKNAKEKKLEETGLELGKEAKGSETISDAAAKIKAMDAAAKAKYLRDVKATDYVGIGKTIWDAKGTFSDSPEDVYAALSRIPSKAVLGSFQTYFKDYYGRELLTFLQSFLSLAEQGKVADVIKRMPEK